MYGRTAPSHGVPSGPAVNAGFGRIGDKDSYTSEEYWSWIQRHTSPTSTMQKPETTLPRPTPRVGRPRVSRKMSADSLLEYRTYQMEDSTEGSPAQRTLPHRSTSKPSQTAQMHEVHTLSRGRPPSMELDSKTGKAKDLGLARKPLQIRTEEFKLYQPDLEDRKAKFDHSIDGLFCVHLFCGHGLKSSRTMLRDLYCVIEVDSINKARTMIRTGAINFDWDEAFDIELENAHEMSFLIYSWDPNTRHRLCFSGTVGLQALLHYGNHQKIALKLEPKGILYLNFTYKDCAVTLQRAPSVRKNGVFGVPLENIVRREKSGQQVPILVKRCIEEVERRGLDHVGIYRLCGSSRRKNQLKEDFERNAKAVDLSPEGVSDINVITGRVSG